MFAGVLCTVGRGTLGRYVGFGFHALDLTNWGICVLLSGYAAAAIGSLPGAGSSLLGSTFSVMIRDTTSEIVVRRNRAISLNDSACALETLVATTTVDTRFSSVVCGARSGFRARKDYSPFAAPRFVLAGESGLGLAAIY